jgi:hypothetical protein
MSGREVDGTEREGHDIVMNCDGRSRLIHECRDGMVIVTTVCEGRSHQTDADEQSEEDLTHKTSR